MKPSGRAEVAGHRVGTEGTWPNKEGEGGGGLAMAENAGRGGREGMCVEKMGWCGKGMVWRRRRGDKLYSFRHLRVRPPIPS